MSSQYAFAPYQDPPEDIPAHEREQAAFHSASHYSSEGPPAQQGQGDAFIGASGGDDRINQYETSLPLRYRVGIARMLMVDWILRLLRRMLFRRSRGCCC